MTGLKQYVLRYWETEFAQLNPKKNKAGNRTYKQSDIDFIEKIKDLLYKRKFTIKGALQFLKNNKDLKTENTSHIDGSNQKIIFQKMKTELIEMKELLKKLK
jgi:DNA-binding transcriptional MerR regulator